MTSIRHGKGSAASLLQTLITETPANLTIDHNVGFESSEEAHDHTFAFMAWAMNMFYSLDRSYDLCQLATPEDMLDLVVKSIRASDSNDYFDDEDRSSHLELLVWAGIEAAYQSGNTVESLRFHREAEKILSDVYPLDSEEYKHLSASFALVSDIIEP